MPVLGLPHPAEALATEGEDARCAPDRIVARTIDGPECVRGAQRSNDLDEHTAFACIRVLLRLRAQETCEVIAMTIARGRRLSVGRKSAC